MSEKDLGAVVYLVCLLCLAIAGPAQGEVTLIGCVEVSGTAADPHDESLPAAARHRLGGFGAIDYTGQAGRYVMVPDRGPDDGNSAFQCRYHEVELLIRPGAAEPLTLRWLGTRILRDEAGQPLVGASARFDLTRADGGSRFDPEAVRVRGDRLYLSDEYGPFVAEFNLRGDRQRLLSPPAYFLITQPSASLPDELARNSTGRIPNRGFESLAISPDGKRLMAVLQSPLLQDAEPGEKGRLYGRHTRLVEFDLSSGRTRQFAYPLADVRNGVSDMVATGGDEYLILERDGLAGTEARYKRVVCVSVSQATDISRFEKLPVHELPPGIVPASRRDFVDLLDPQFGLAGPDLPEKFEGMTFGPMLPDGRHSLVISVDNDFVPAAATRILVFAFSDADLPTIPAGLSAPVSRR